MREGSSFFGHISELSTSLCTSHPAPQLIKDDCTRETSEYYLASILVVAGKGIQISNVKADI